VVAIGEIGLDYHWDKSPKAVQHRALALQLELAANLDLPVIIHNRESSADVMRLLAESPLVGRENPGVLHSFSADWETAVSALDLGYYLGITGPVTFKKAEELRKIAHKIPTDRLLIETDAPFLTPHPYRGKRNEPAYVAYVAERLAAVRGVKTAVLARQTTENARRLFKQLNQ
ncbi:MAG: TatD family hydrolase, partial [Chloroflexi bacterium]|nr:TatD family hydrolase [Chloroflexota bacterium]